MTTRALMLGAVSGMDSKPRRLPGGGEITEQACKQGWAGCAQVEVDRPAVRRVPHVKWGQATGPDQTCTRLQGEKG